MAGDSGGFFLLLRRRDGCFIDGGDSNNSAGEVLYVDGNTISTAGHAHNDWIFITSTEAINAVQYNESSDGGLKLNLQKANSNVSASVVEDEEEPEMEIPEESKVGKKLSDLTTKRVIILVLAMMFSVVLFSTSTYITENTSYQFGLEFIMAYGPNINSTGFVTAFESYKNDHKDLRTPLILLNANNKIWESNVNPDSLRVSEKEVVSVGNGDYVAIFDLTENTRLTAGLSLAQTFFVCVVLAAGSMIFSKTATDLVIAPIE